MRTTASRWRRTNKTSQRPPAQPGHEKMNGSKRYGPSGHERISSSLRVRFVRPISPFPSPRPSPSGRGRILRWFSTIPCAVSARQTSRTSESADGCSLSPWKRVRERGIGLRSYKPTRANPVNVELCESSGAAGCMMRLGVLSFSKPSVVHEPGLLSFVLLAAALLGPVDGIQAADQDWPVYLDTTSSIARHKKAERGNSGGRTP